MRLSFGSRRARLATETLTGVYLVLMSTGCAYNYMAQRAMDREVTRLPRDPDTLVIKGAEAVTLPGSGPNAALLVHGFVASRTDFNDLGAILQETGLTVRMMRLPGHATFPVDHANTTNDQFLDAVRREYLALKIHHPKVALIGFSMGGALSTLIASEEKVDRLVLIAPYYGVTHRWYYILPAEAWNTLSSWAIPYVMKNRVFTCVNREEAKDKLYAYRVISTKGAGELIRLGKLARDPERLGRVRCPVLMLHSRGDRAASPKRAEQAFEALGSADKRVKWYQESNHHLLWDHEMEDVKREIVSFLEPITKE